MIRIKKNFYLLLMGFSLFFCVSAEVNASDAEKKSVASYAYESLPYKYTSSYITPVKNGQGTNLCWAYAGMAAAESNWYMNTGELVEYDVRNTAYNALASFADPLGNIKDITQIKDGELTVNCMGEAKIITNAASAWQIPCKEGAHDDDSYVLNQEEDIVAHEQNCIQVPSDNMYEIKKNIMEHGSGSLMFFWDMNEMGSEGTCYTSWNLMPNHSVCIVGWDDSFSKDRFKNKPQHSGAWLCKNNWGKWKGTEGYIWISYDDRSINNTITFWEYENSDNYMVNYQYDGALATEQITSNTQNASGANVFTAKHTELIKAIEYATVDANIDYEIKIYSGVSIGGSPDTGTLEVTQTGSEKYAGYHTVSLNKAVRVNKGSRFSVIVTIKSNLSCPSIVLESSDLNGKFYLSSEVCEKGQSFYRFADTNTWLDVYDKPVINKDYGNIRIKALGDTQDYYSIYSAAHDGGYTVELPKTEVMKGKTINMRIKADPGRIVTDFALYEKGKKIAPVNVSGGYAYYSFTNVQSNLYIAIYDLSIYYPIQFHLDQSATNAMVIREDGKNITTGMGMTYNDTLKFRISGLSPEQLSKLSVKNGESMMHCDESGFYSFARCHSRKDVYISADDTSQPLANVLLDAGTGISVLSTDDDKLTSVSNCTCGEDFGFKVIGKPGYTVEDVLVLVDGKVVKCNKKGYYTISNIYGEHDIVVTGAQVDDNLYEIESDSNIKSIFSGKVTIIPKTPAKYIYDIEQDKSVNKLVINSETDWKRLNPLKIYVSSDPNGYTKSNGVTIKKDIDNEAPILNYIYLKNDVLGFSKDVELSNSKKLSKIKIKNDIKIIEGECIEKVSGLKNAYFYVDYNPGEIILSDNELGKVEWESVFNLKDSTVSLKPDKDYVVYTYSVDKAGNVSDYYHTPVMKMEHQ